MSDHFTTLPCKGLKAKFGDYPFDDMIMKSDGHDRIINRSSHQRCSVRKGLPTLAQVFSCEFCEISKNTFLTDHLRMTASE